MPLDLSALPPIHELMESRGEEVLELARQAH